jgi:hypothetical protein
MIFIIILYILLIIIIIVLSNMIGYKGLLYVIYNIIIMIFFYIFILKDVKGNISVYRFARKHHFHNFLWSINKIHFHKLSLLNKQEFIEYDLFKQNEMRQIKKLYRQKNTTILEKALLKPIIDNNFNKYKDITFIKQNKE